MTRNRERAVDQWLRGTLQETEEHPTRGAMQLAVLKERIRVGRRRRRPLRWGLVLAPLVLLATFLGEVPRLGGNAFQLQEVETAREGTRVVQNELGGYGFNIFEGDNEDDVYELQQQIAAVEGVIVGVEGLEIQGRIDWSWRIEHTVNGETRTMSKAVAGESASSLPGLRDFYRNDFAAMMAGIESGDIPASAPFAASIGGKTFNMRKWTVTSTCCGEVSLYEGTIIR